MEYVAVSKNVKMSPRKVRLVAEGIKDMPLSAAIAQLTVLNKRASTPVRKVLESAIANAKNKDNVKKEDLVIKEIMVNGGVSYKRYHFAARGRTRPYKKRTSHIRVVLESSIEVAKEPVVEPKTEVVEEKKETGVRKLIKGRRGAKKEVKE